jgi:hypothetical protein
MQDLPVDFVNLAQSAMNGGSGYPYSIRASDLMQNFHFCNLVINDQVDGIPQPFTTNENIVGQNFIQKSLVFNPPPPDDGKTYVLAFNGQYTWLPTEEC